MMQHTFVAWSFWRGHPHRYGSWGIWNITQVSSKRMVRWKQSMVGFSYLLSQENNLVLRRVATCWFSLVSSFEGCSRRYVSSPVLASLMSILPLKLKSALSICSDSIASSYNPSRQFINIQRIWTDQLRLYNHILLGFAWKAEKPIGSRKWQGPTPFPASGSFYPSSDSGDREYFEYSSATS